MFRQNVGLSTLAPDSQCSPLNGCGQIRSLRTEPGVTSALGTKGMNQRKSKESSQDPIIWQDVYRQVSREKVRPLPLISVSRKQTETLAPTSSRAHTPIPFFRYNKRGCKEVGRPPREWSQESQESWRAVNKGLTENYSSSSLQGPSHCPIVIAELLRSMTSYAPPLFSFSYESLS